MAGQYIGPLYGPLPELEFDWHYQVDDPENPGEKVTLYSRQDMREMLREMQDLRVAYDQMSKLTIAMNSIVAISPNALANVKDDIVKWVDLRDQVDAKQEVVPELRPGELPIIKADVVEYSEEPLKGGAVKYTDVQLQSVRERMSRLQMSVCRTLDLCAFDLNEAVCCSGPSAAHGFARGSAPLYRS